MIVSIRSIPIQYTTVEGDTEFMILESPNANDPFQFAVSRMNIRGKYRDKNNMLRRKHDLYTVRWTYNYESHGMDIRKLLTAETIQIATPPDFAVDYTGYDVIFLNREAIKDYLSGLSAAGQTFETFDIIPSGSVTLEFEIRKPLTWEQILELKWFEAIGEGDPGPDPDPAPDAPENFLATVDHPDVSFAWDVVTDVDGYNVYINSSSGFEKHNETLIETNSYEILAIDTGEYSAYVTAVKDEQESDPSNEVDFLIYNDNQISVINNLQVWAVSNDIDQANESNVNTFFDRQENHDATAMSTPPILRTNHLNGHSVVDFENSNNMTFGTPSFGDTNLMAEASDEFTLFIVTLMKGSGYSIAKADGGVTNSDFVFGLGKLGTNERYINLRSQRNDYPGATDNQFCIERVKWDGATPDYKVGNVISETPSIGTRSNLTTQNVILGGRTNATGFSMDGMIAEYLIFDRSLSSEEDQLVRDYLGIKYDLPV